MRHLFTRCMDGHFFAGLTCPNDGSRSNASEALAAILEPLDDGETTIEALLRAGFPHALLPDVLIIEKAWPRWPDAHTIQLLG